MRRQVQALLLLTLVLILTACGVSQTPPTGWKYIYTGNHKCHYFVKDGGVHNMTYVKQYLYICCRCCMEETKMTNEEKMKSDFNSGAAFEIGEPNPYGKYFTGQSYLKMLAKDKDLGAINVTFEPGCRNFWHKLGWCWM